MAGETDLTQLLKTMQPVLREGEYVFCTLPDATQCPPHLDPVGYFKEDEGLTLMLPKSQADTAGLPYTAVFALITLTVHSSLEAVGFMAAIATHLASHGISVNPVSAFYHDHLFVPTKDAERAMALLQSLTDSACSQSPA
ncbi:ACT domain-containing protein [Leptolyngbya sp. CCNP1308]|uniref:ACT domain-containing protein n=1 Tax=Leptolyngbya sp. CCNP1308 TaxID=3110255 RepID=UPI002B21CEE9|nr:ACT domain-containing protein [Leptolyngbya sp. CCNP1308]MEA5449841.1 ACT domain-containing protein [Leptolyngbya sp. CCNP1308]